LSERVADSLALLGATPLPARIESNREKRMGRFGFSIGHRFVGWPTLELDVKKSIPEN
jgi:hypothetical protein